MPFYKLTLGCFSKKQARCLSPFFILALMCLLPGCDSSNKSSDNPPSQEQMTPSPTSSPVVTSTPTPAPTPTPDLETTPSPAPSASTITLSGEVTTFPDTAAGIASLKVREEYSLSAYQKASEQISGYQKSSRAEETLGRSDMVPASALVSIFLLSDVNFTNPIATVKTDEQGRYEIRAEDVIDYLVSQALVDASATEDQVVTAFRALGKLTVRALIVKNIAGQSQALAIQSIADPNDIDDTTGEPIPTPVDPIVHRVVKAIVDEIRESIQSLEALGLSQTSVQQLAETVITTVANEVARVIDEAADSVITIPEGQTIEDVIAQQEAQTIIDVTGGDLDQLESVIDGTAEDEEAALKVLEENVVNADEEVDEADSTLSTSLGSDEQGLLAGLGSILDEVVTDEVDEVIEKATEAGTLSTVLEIADGQTTEQVLAQQATEKNRLLTRSVQRFFLSMGLAVMVDQNADGTAGVIALSLSAPPHIPESALPGGRGFGDRQIRVFTVGAGALDSDSDFTSDPTADLGALDSEGVPQAPLFFAPKLSDVVAVLLNGATVGTMQEQVDQAFKRIADPSGTPSTSDFDLIDRLRLFHELDRRLSDATVVSHAVISKIVANKSHTLTIGQLAAVIANNFSWAKESVNLTPEGFPVFTGRRALLTGGESVVDSSTLVRVLSLSLGKSPTETAKILTERESFYGQYAGDAVQAAIQNARFSGGATFDLIASLLGIYPEEAAGYFALVVGSETTPAAPEYAAAKDRVARGLTSSVPASLFNRTLNSGSDINIRSALFLMDFVLKSQFLIDSASGYFKQRNITDAQGADNLRIVPNFDNLKFLKASDEVTVATIVSEMLDITLIDNGEFFRSVSPIIYRGLAELPLLPEFREQEIDDFVDDLGEGARSEKAKVSCTVERFDGQDPAIADGGLKLSVFDVTYDDDTGAFTKGAAISASISSVLVEGNGPVRRRYTVDNLPSEKEPGDFGRDYVIRFGIDGYQNALPEIFALIDGFSPDLVLCDAKQPLLIAPDEKFVPVPSVGLATNQGFEQADGSFLSEGIDLSNFELPGLPVHVSELEESEGRGQRDFDFDAVSSGFALTAADGVGFAPLYGAYIDGELTLALTDSDSLDPLFGIPSVIAGNFRPLLERLLADDSALNATIDVSRDPSVFEHGRLYLMRDVEGRFWVLELRAIDVSEDPNATKGFIEIGFASVNSLGEIDIPEANFDDVGGGADDPNAPGGRGLFWQHMLYGDWLVLDSPSNYTGHTLVEPKEVSFGRNPELYEQLDAASDGIFIRYAGRHFEENITSVDDFDTVFGEPRDFSSIPLRLDAGRDGITFVKLSFNRQNLSYVMEPAPSDAGAAVTQLKHNDLVAVFDNNIENGDSPIYIGRVLRERPADDPEANWEIAFEWIRVADIDAQGENDPKNVVCLLADRDNCPADQPVLAFSSDLKTGVGAVFDMDFDGVPSLFDPNDSDANIPGAPRTGGASGGNHEGLEFYALAESNGQGGVDLSFVAKTINLYPGEIQAVKVRSPIFGAQSDSQIIFSCTPAREGDSGFSEFACTARDLANDVTVVRRSQRVDGVEFTLSPPSTVVNGLGNPIEFEYDVSFRAPTDLSGAPQMCDDAACPARPSIAGSRIVRIPENPAVLKDLSITIGSQEPVEFSGVSSVDVTRELFITGDPIAGAIDYELSIYCPGSAPEQPYFPEENLQFRAPAVDPSGQVARPEFTVNIHHLGGRRCDFTLNAFLQSEAGDFIGVSAVRINNIKTTGGGGGGIVDNELDLIEGSEVCLETDDTGNLRPFVNTCTDDNRLFTVAELLQGDKEGSAILSLGSGVKEARADGGRRLLTEGVLETEAIVTINVDLSNPDVDIEPPTCGIISSDAFSDTCAIGEHSDARTELLIVDSNAAFLLLNPDLPISLNIFGPDGQVDAIPLDKPAFYVLEDAPEGKPVMEVEISQFPDADGTAQISGKFTLTAGANDYRSGDANINFDVTAPGFMFVDHNLGQPVDFGLRFIRSAEMRVAWFLPPPRVNIIGEHNLFGDEATDLTIGYEAGVWRFVFPASANIEALEQPGPNGPTFVDAEADGGYRVDVDESAGGVEFFLKVGGEEVRVSARFEGPGEGHLSSEISFGGKPPGDPGDCPDCPKPLFNLSLADGSATLSYDGNINTEGLGEPLVDISVSADGILVSIPVGMAGELQMFDFDAQQVVTGREFTLPRNGNFTMLNYANGGLHYDIEVQDFGVDVLFNIWDRPDKDDPGIPGEEPQRNPDLDGDQVINAVDNCPLIANPDQLDTDANGLGDLCDKVVPDMSGDYVVTVTHLAGSQELDDAENACEPGVDETLLVSVTMQGNQVFVREGREAVLWGIMDANAGLTLFSDDENQVVTEGSYNQADQSFSFHIEETESSDDGAVNCQASIDVVGSSGDKTVSESAAFSSALAYFEAEHEYADRPPEFEYGVLKTGALEEPFFWDFSADPPQWVLVRDIEQDAYLTANGIAMVDDLIMPTGTATDTGDTVIVKPTLDGIASDVQVYHVDLEAFDISSAVISDILPEGFEDGLDDSTQFRDGSLAYVATITTQVDAYPFWCDNEGGVAAMVCKNIVAAGFNETGPIPATSLNDIVTTPAELDAGTANGANIWLGSGHDSKGKFDLAARLISSDGTTTGSEFRAAIVRTSATGEFDIIEFIDVSTLTINETTVLEFVLPIHLQRMAEIRGEERIPFLFVESELEGEPFVRRGAKQAAGTVIKEVLYNETALEDVLNNFVPMSGVLPPPPPPTPPSPGGV